VYEFNDSTVINGKTLLNTKVTKEKIP